MRPVEAIKTCLAKSFQFSGRASLSEFWWFYGVWTLGAVAMMSLRQVEIPYISEWAPESIYGAPALLFIAVFLPPLLSAGARRFQDTDAPGQFFPVLAVIYISIEVQAHGPSFAGFVASLALFFRCIRLPSPGPNQYGPNPLEPQ